MNIDKTLLEHLIKLLKQSGVNSKKQVLEILEDQMKEENFINGLVATLPTERKDLYTIGKKLECVAIDLENLALLNNLIEEDRKEELAISINNIELLLKDLKKIEGKNANWERKELA